MDRNEVTRTERVGRLSLFITIENDEIVCRSLSEKEIAVEIIKEQPFFRARGKQHGQE